MLEAIFNVTGAPATSLVTACNPLGELLDDTENEQRHAALFADVATLGWRSLAATGRDPNGQWPAEQSLLVIGPDLHAAAALGTRHGQNAILVSDENFTPRLVLLR